MQISKIILFLSTIFVGTSAFSQTNIILKIDSSSNELSIDRSKFNVRYGSDSFFDNLGDKVINDMFTLNIKIIIME